MTVVPKTSDEELLCCDWWCEHCQEGFDGQEGGDKHQGPDCTWVDALHEMKRRGLVSREPIKPLKAVNEAIDALLHSVGLVELMVVEDAYWVVGRGLMVTGFITRNLKPGLPARVINPDEDGHNTVITGVEQFAMIYKEGQRRSAGLLLRGMPQDSVKKGAVVYLLEE